MVTCYRCNFEASEYVSVIYALDGRHQDEGTNEGDNYVCEEHLDSYLSSFLRPGVEVLEITINSLPGR